MSNERKHHTSEEKVAILRRHPSIGFRFPLCATNINSTPPCSTGGSSSSLRTGLPPDLLLRNHFLLLCHDYIASGPNRLRRTGLMVAVQRA